MTDFEVTYPKYEIETQNYNNDKVKTKYHEKNGIVYTILNYDSSIVCFDDSNIGFYRSLIISNPENKLLCFSPQKSVPLDNFMEKYPITTNKILANEIIEGTMINLFFDNRSQKWEIATKGGVGGNYFFYRNQYKLDNDKSKQQPTFYRMFLDALCASDTQELNDVPLVENLSKNYCYSFVLQHPANHIVLQIKKAKLYLVGVYELLNNTVVHILCSVYENWNELTTIQGIIDFPKRYTVTTYEDMESKYCSIQKSFTQLGVMFTNIETGERASMQSPNYEEMKFLRGNNPNLQYQYLCLRKMNKVKDFLQYFPQYKSIFYNFYEEYNQFITNIHSSYLTYYVQKQQIKISKKFFPHIYKIHHELYLPSLQTETPLIIRRRVIYEYFEAMEPRSILYYLNYDNRKLETMDPELSSSTSSSSSS